MLSHMRTTIRLPDDLYQEVRVTAVRQGGTVTAFIEGALRAALRDHDCGPARPPYQVRPFAGSGLQPGVDLDDNAALLELMDVRARP